MIKYKIEKGSRIKKGSIRRTDNTWRHHFFGISCPSNGYWYDDDSDHWFRWDDVTPKMNVSSIAHAWSVRKFRRKLKHWKNDLPNGTIMTLSSMLVDSRYDVTGVIYNDKDK